MRNTARVARIGTAVSLALPLTLSALILGAAAASAGSGGGGLSLDGGAGRARAEMETVRAPSRAEPVLAGLMLVSALISLAWLRSRQTRSAASSGAGSR